MKIALASDSPGLDGSVPVLFSQSPYLLVVNAENNELLHSIARSGIGGTREEQDIVLAGEILRWDCEGVLCGPIERAPFLIIADEGQVTRYKAAGMSIGEALDGLRKRSLELIRDHVGGAGCQGEHREDAGTAACGCRDS